MNNVRINFLIALRDNLFDRNILRILAKETPLANIFEAHASGEITLDDAIYIAMLQRESNYGIIRFLNYIRNVIFN